MTRGHVLRYRRFGIVRQVLAETFRKVKGHVTDRKDKQFKSKAETFSLPPAGGLLYRILTPPARWSTPLWTKGWVRVVESSSGGVETKCSAASRTKTEPDRPTVWISVFFNSNGAQV